MTAASPAVSGLPWPSFRHAGPAFGAVPQDRLHARRFVRATLLPLLALALLLPWLPPPPARSPAASPPMPLARLLPPPTPDPARLVPPPTPDPARLLPPPTPDPAAPRPPVAPPDAQAPATRVATVVPEARRPQPQRRAGERDPQQPLASGVGLLALKQQLAQIHGAPTAVQITPPAQPGRGVGQGQGPGVGAGGDSGVPLRALITSQAAGGGGGLATAAYSRDSGGGGLPGRATTLVAGVAGGSGGGGPGGGGVGLPGTRAGAGGLAPPGGGGSGSGSAQRARRSIEDIKLVFDRHKGAIHAIYNRALRDDPALQGKVVLELRIAPGGEVVDCRVLSTELRAAELERKLVARVRQFDFGAKDVDPMVVTWPVDFLPS